MYYVLEVVRDNKTVWGFNTSNIFTFYDNLVLMKKFNDEIYIFHLCNGYKIVKTYFTSKNIYNIMNYCKTFYLFTKRLN